MSTVTFGKWIGNISVEDAVADVARRSLQCRLAAVLYYLPRAARAGNSDIEDVHQLRVATRRAMAAMDLYASMLPKGRACQLRSSLKKIRRAAGTARDLDVLILRLSANESELAQPEILEDLRDQRLRAQRPIRRIHRRLKRNKSLKRQIRGLLQRVRLRGADKELWQDRTFGPWAERQLREIVNAFFAASPTGPTDLDALHRFRIEGKKLRYAMELLAAAFPDAFRKQLYPAVEQLQENLGQVNDHAVAWERYRGWLQSKQHASRQTGIERLLDHEATALAQARESFEAWWTRQRRTSLRAQFDEIAFGQVARSAESPRCLAACGSESHGDGHHPGAEALEKRAADLP